MAVGDRGGGGVRGADAVGPAPDGRAHVNGQVLRGRGSTPGRGAGAAGALLVALLVLTAAGAGCAAGAARRAERELDGLVGRATTADVLRSWGEPQRRIRTDGAELWLYRHVVLRFDDAGRLQSWHVHED